MMVQKMITRKILLVHFDPKIRKDGAKRRGSHAPRLKAELILSLKHTPVAVGNGRKMIRGQ